MKVKASILCLLFLSTSLLSQTIKMPEKVEVAPNRLASITMDYEGDDVTWVVDDKLDVFREYDPNPSRIRLRVIAYEQGIFKISAVTCKDKKLSPIYVCKVIAGNVPPVPPGPNPPTPDPNPPSPAPIPAEGLRVLIVYETQEENKLTGGQLGAIFGKEFRDRLNAKCTIGTDGKTREWRIWDKDVDPSFESKLWQDAFKRKRGNLPWIIISNGKSGYEGPLPEKYDDTVSLLSKYGG